MSRDALLRYRADRLLRKDFSGLRPRVIAAVRARLRSRGLSLDPEDLDECYAQAWQGLYSRMLSGERIDDIAAWLVVVAHRRAIDELRARTRQRRAHEARAELAEVAGSRSRLGTDFAAELDDRARLRAVLEGFSGGLSLRERQAASLCYLQDLSRSQAARHMGISEARMRKLMDGSSGRTGVAAKVSALLDTIGAGRWCEQQGSLMRAYAYGLLDPEGERHALAHAHLRECPACRAFVLCLRGLATVLPPLPLPFASFLGASRAAPRRARRRVRRRAGRRVGRRAGRGAGAARRTLTRVAASHGMRMPLAKLALVVAAMLSVGGGVVVLARGASRHVSRLPSSATHVGVVPGLHRALHRPQRPARRRGTRHRSVRHRPAQVLSTRSRPQAPALPKPATVASSSRAVSEARSPGEEFSPERPVPRRG